MWIYRRSRKCIPDSWSAPLKLSFAIITIFHTDFEKRAIRATGEIQEVLGCGVSFHPGRDKRAPFEIIRMYLEAGGRADKCIMSHLDSK